MPNIVIAFDGSDGASKALETLAWFDRDSLRVFLVSAVSGPAIDTNGDGIEADAEEVARAEANLEAVRREMGARGIKVESRIVIGDPPKAVIEAAKALSADLIITGCRGLGLAKRLVFGSVSSAILRDAPCPVLVTR